jgi:hypothetical protein
MPLFHAISYVWGDPTKSAEILIDGKPLKITRNLYDILRAIQKDEIADVNVWADAICINQDDLRERSAQILLMREIYRAAFQVRIWLGHCSDDALRCLKFIDKLNNPLVTVTTEDQPYRSAEELESLNKGFGKLFVKAAASVANASFRTVQGIKELEDLVNTPVLDDKVEVTLDPDGNLSLHQELIDNISDWRPSNRGLAKVEYEGYFREIAALIGKIFLENEWFERMWVVQASASPKNQKPKPCSTQLQNS